jgi:hypothetical protein
LNGLDEAGQQLFSFSGIVLRAKTLFGMGYANEKHFFGLNSSNDLYLLNANEYSQLIYSFGAFRIYYGRRIRIK